MTTSIRAHFDGRVIVPDEPVDLPVNKPLEVHLSPVEDGQGEAERQERLRRVNRAIGFMRHRVVPDEALRREAIYGDES
ncbi:MAG: hypothetical protein AB1716_11820 [Planctomycetota bacterium]